MVIKQHQRRSIQRGKNKIGKATKCYMSKKKPKAGNLISKKQN